MALFEQGVVQEDLKLVKLSLVKLLLTVSLRKGHNFVARLSIIYISR